MPSIMYLSSCRIEVSLAAVPNRNRETHPKRMPVIVVQQCYQISQLCLHSPPVPVVVKLSGLQTVEPAEICVPRGPFYNNHSIEVDPTKFETGNGTCVSNSCTSLESSAFFWKSIISCHERLSIGLFKMMANRLFGSQVNYHLSV